MLMLLIKPLTCTVYVQFVFDNLLYIDCLGMYLLIQRNMIEDHSLNIFGNLSKEVNRIYFPLTVF